MVIRKLQKTSVQLPPDAFRDMETWPGLTRSEAIRLSVERANYLATLNAEKIASLASVYEPILRMALEDFGYEDYRVVARVLPAIVVGFLRENPNMTWRYEGGDNPELNTDELLEKLTCLDAVGRIGVLDCIVAQRHRGEAKNEQASAAMPRRTRSRGVKPHRPE